MNHTRRHRGFTIIELLVVVTIIAVLIALLLPAVDRAQRQVKVIQCSANLKSYALGLIVYATEDAQGIYPTHSVDNWGFARTVWSSGTHYNSVFPDKNRYLPMFENMICGGDLRILWCPLDIYWYNPLSDLASAGLHDGQYTLLWYDNRFQDNYMGGYYRFAHMLTNSPVPIFANSGNVDPSGPPMQPGSAQDAILADAINSNGPPSPPEQFFQSPHMDWSSVYAFEAQRKRRENNVAYSDGHVETHGGGYIGGDGYFTWQGAGWVMHGGSPWRLQY